VFPVSHYRSRENQVLEYGSNGVLIFTCITPLLHHFIPISPFSARLVVFNHLNLLNHLNGLNYCYGCHPPPSAR
jgi:hypothetical protein